MTTHLPVPTLNQLQNSGQQSWIAMKVAFSHLDSEARFRLWCAARIEIPRLVGRSAYEWRYAWLYVVLLQKRLTHYLINKSAPYTQAIEKMIARASSFYGKEFKMFLGGPDCQVSSQAWLALEGVIDKQIYIQAHVTAMSSPASMKPLAWRLSSCSSSSE